MNIAKMIESLPNSVKENIIDFTDVPISVNGKTKHATRVLVGRILTDSEKDELRKVRNILIVGTGIAYYKYAPEIKHSYFYIA